MKKFFMILVAVLVTTLPNVALTQIKHGTNCAACHTLTEKEATELLQKAGGTVTSVKHAPVKGLFELQVERNGQKGLIYMDYSKKHLMQGMAFDRTKLEPVTAHKLDLQQPKQPTTVDVKTIPLDGAITLGDSKAAKKLYVFTDPDCPYCRKFHEELKKLQKIAPDIAIQVVLYPLPMHPEAYDKARIIVETRSIDILNSAFEGKKVPKPRLESSKQAVDDSIRFANANGITGTPAMVFPDGKLELGMRDAENLKKMLDGK